MDDDRSPEEKLADEEKRAFKDIHRAHQVSQILDSGAFVEAVEAVKQQIYDEFAKSALDDDLARLRARVSIDLLNRILKNLRHHIDTGKMAQGVITSIEEKRRQSRKNGERLN